MLADRVATQRAKLAFDLPKPADVTGRVRQIGSARAAERPEASVNAGGI
jgi:hypothetical protein